MPCVHTHYDNLKVAKNAPMEVIHAAYKSLAAMYHHPGDPESERIMRIINNSYIALCDPVRKGDHDRWIAQQDSVEFVRPASEPPDDEPVPPKAVPLPIVRKPLGRHSLLAFAGVIIAVTLIGAFFSSTSSNPTKASAPTPERPAISDAPDTTTPEVALPPRVASPDPPPLIRRLVPAYRRSPLAPNGETWPTVSGYMTGYPLLNADGQSSLTIDNRKNGSDVIVKLYDVGASPPTPARVIFLQAGDRLKMETIDAGQYDLRYQDLNSGSRFGSESFRLTEGHETTRRDDGATVRKSQASDDTITLYTTPEGRFKFREIGPGEF
jgi:hypothetical protein